MTIHGAWVEITNGRKQGKKLAAIYGLFDRDRCLYVGQTANPITRRVPHVGKIYRQLAVITQMRILAVVPFETRTGHETDWIKHYSELGQAELNVNQTGKSHR